VARGRNGWNRVWPSVRTPHGTHQGPEPANKPTAFGGDFQPDFTKALARPESGSSGHGEDLGAVGGHGNGVLEMGREAPIRGHHAPVVVEEHGLGEPTLTMGSTAKTLPVLRVGLAPGPVIGTWGCSCIAVPMACPRTPDHAEAGGLGHVLDRPADFVQGVSLVICSIPPRGSARSHPAASGPPWRWSRCPW